MARTIDLRCWGDPASPQHVLYVHGLGAHSGWVAPLAESLADQDLFVTAGDLPGHGKRRLPDPASGRDKPESHIPSPGGLLDAVAEMLRASTSLRADPESAASAGNPANAAKAANAASGTWIMGTSLGGCLAALFAANAVAFEDAAGPAVRGIVLLAPAFRPYYLPLGEMIDMAFHLGNRAKTYATPVARGIRICADDVRQQALGADPLGTPGFDARSHLWAQVLIAKSEFQLRRVRVPVLCFQGDHDRVVDAKHNEKLIASHRCGHFEWVRGGFHDLQAEPDIDEFGTRLARRLLDTGDQGWA